MVWILLSLGSSSSIVSSVRSKQNWVVVGTSCVRHVSHNCMGFFAIDSALEGVVGATMSSTGFVTFLDLTSVTCAASTPLTSKPQILDVTVAPEPRDMIWANAHVSDRSRARSERTVNFVLFIGVFFWIFPVCAISLLQCPVVCILFLTFLSVTFLVGCHSSLCKS